MGGFLAGAVYPFRALGVLRRNPPLRRYVIVPILLNLAVGATIYAALLFGGFRLIDGWMAAVPESLRFLGSLLRVVLLIGLLLLTGWVLVRFGVVLGAPFYTALSQRLEQIVTGLAPPADPFSLGAVLRDIGRALAFELQKLLLVGLGAGIILLGNLLPVVGQVVGVAGWVALGALLACLDFLDPPLERRRLRFREKLGVIRRALPASAGFGLVAVGLVSIPFLNLLSIPLLITAGTLFFCERIGGRGTPAA